MKRYLYIILGIVVLAVIAIGVILFLKNQQITSTGTSGTTGTLPGVGTQTGSTGASGNGSTQTQSGSSLLSLPATSSSTPSNGQLSAGSFGILSTTSVLDYFVDAHNTITAINPDGSVISIANGQSSTISSTTISDIISASFSYDGKKILVSYGSPNNPQASVFDVAAQTWTALPAGLQSPQWSPNSYQVAYLATTASGKLALAMLNVSNLKSGSVTLLSLHANDMDLKWPNKNDFILSDKPSLYNAGSAWLFNSQTGSLTSLISEQYGSESIWGPSNNTLGLVFFENSLDQNGDLSLENLSGNVVQAFTFLTLPSKCLFNNETSTTSSTNGSSTATTTSSSYVALYCGIPRSSSGFSSAQLPDAYNMMALFTSDDIYKINTTSGQTQELWSDSAQNIDTSDLKVFNGTLFFVNRYNQELYGLVLQ